MCTLLRLGGRTSSGRSRSVSISQEHFDVLVADYHLNYGETGFDVAAILSENNVSFAQILVTANRSNDIRESGGATISYLPKPLKPAA